MTGTELKVITPAASEVLGPDVDRLATLHTNAKTDGELLKVWLKSHRDGSAHTVRVYSRVGERFLAALAAAGAGLRAATVEDVLQAVEAMRVKEDGSPVKPATVKRIKLATGICLVVERDPIHLAKHVASLDYLSGGRFIFGIGGGWNAEEMANHGTDFKTRFSLMRERIVAMKAIWTNDVAEYQGVFVNFEPLWAWPKPVQKPHPPILVGGEFPHGAKRAIEYGNGWMPIGGRGLDALDILPRFRQMAAEAGAQSR